jgi:hypothetical protein
VQVTQFKGQHRKLRRINRSTGDHLYWKKIDRHQFVKVGRSPNDVTMPKCFAELQENFQISAAAAVDSKRPPRALLPCKIKPIDNRSIARAQALVEATEPADYSLNQHASTSSDMFAFLQKDCARILIFRQPFARTPFANNPRANRIV